MKKPFFATLICCAVSSHLLAQAIPNNAIADLVLGQPNFTSNTSLLTSSFTLSEPTGVVVDPVTEKVFVSEQGNRRVLRFRNHKALTSGAGAEAVFGKSRFGSPTSGSGDFGMSDVNGLYFDRLGRLWVCDTENNRVLMFEAASYRESQPFADRVFGQPDFTTNSSGTTSSKMNRPFGVCVDSQDRLWVADIVNNRVLRFDSISTKNNGAAADGVLGQSLFTTSTQGSGSSGIQDPVGLTVSKEGNLFVACSGANRVLRFNGAASLGNGAGASAVYGQPDFSSVVSGATAAKMAFCCGVHITANDTLWVADSGNNRILRFDKASTKPSGSAANGVIGQANFTTNTSGSSNRTLATPFANPFVDASGNLWTPDFSNNRVLRFPSDVTKPLLAVTSRVPASVSSSKLVIKGTASDTYGISLVQYKVGTGPLTNATGTTSWKFTAALKTGKNKITIYAVDSVGNKSATKTLTVTRGANVISRLAAAD